MQKKSLRGAVTLMTLMAARSVGARSILAALAVLAALPSPMAAAPPRPPADALPPGHPSCHAREFGAADLAAHPDRRVTAISLERIARDLAAERKWGKVEQFDDTPHRLGDPAGARALAFAAVLPLPAAPACAEPDVLFPPATAGCYVGTEIAPAAAGAPPYRKPAVPVTAVRPERGYPQLAHEEEWAPPRRAIA